MKFSMGEINMKCPECGSKNIGQHRSPIGPIWCCDCHFNVPHKERENPFIENVIPIEKNKPHKLSKVVCLKCLHMWIAVRTEETLLKNLECPECFKIGFVIETGEVMDTDEFSE